MAITITSSYGGEGALPYIAPAILSGDSIANGYITVKTGVKKALALKVLNGTDLIQDFACDFDASTSALTLAEAILTPTELMTNVQVCKSDFRQDYEALETGNGFINDQIPPSFADFMLLFLADKVAEAIEKNIWHGDYNETDGTTTGGNAVVNFSGILAKIVAGTPGFESTSAGAYTADADATTGILAKLDLLAAGAPDSIQGDAKTSIYMSRKSQFLLQRAMSGLGTNVSPTFVGEARPFLYLGYNIIVPAGFPNDTLVISQVENFYFGTDLTSDFNEAKVLDMSMLDGSDNLRVAMRYVGATQVAVLGDVGVTRRSS
jgi:hypothetical protein